MSMTNSDSSDRYPAEDGSDPGVRLLHALEGHKETVLCAAFNGSGTVLATSSEDNTVKLWSAVKGEMLRTLEGHRGSVWRLAFDPIEGTLVSGSDDRTVKLWNVGSGALLHTLEGHNGSVVCVAVTQMGGVIASGSGDNTVKLWNVRTGELVRTLEAHEGSVRCVAFDGLGNLASGGFDGTVKLWDVDSGKLLRTFKAHRGIVWDVEFDPTGRTLASSGDDNVINRWSVADGRLLGTLEGHTSRVDAIKYSGDGHLLASRSEDGTIRLWNCETWDAVAIIREPTRRGWWTPCLAFHPTLPWLVTSGGNADVADLKRCELIHVWQLNLELPLSQAAFTQSVHYVNAKVLIVGDTGVGKSALSLVLSGKSYQPTDSTSGRQVYTFDSEEAILQGNRKQTRETLLWDLAGQPGYRLIHQLHLNEVAVALVVFDARSETDPFAGVRHWERALKLAQQRQGSQAVPMRKFLVAARVDRGGISVSKERLQTIIREYGFDGYFETSSKEGWQIDELKRAIASSILWNRLPVVTSSKLFASMKEYLLQVKKAGTILAPMSSLYEKFCQYYRDDRELTVRSSRPSGIFRTLRRHLDLSPEFRTCISRLETRDLIRGLSFGGYVLLQPELLDAYASAIVNAAKNEPDGFGSILEEAVLCGSFFMPEDQRIHDPSQEQLLLHATVEELIRHDLALRENANDGRYLVFPAQFNRDYQEAPDPKGKAVAMTFEGPVQNVYSTLAVRLAHTGLFETGRTEMWRNAVIFSALAGGKCGLLVRELAEARGQLLIFFDAHVGNETRFYFEEYVLAHLRRRSLGGSVELSRFFVCADCATPVPDVYVEMSLRRGLNRFNCPCGQEISLMEPKEKVQYTSKVESMNNSADRKRDFEAFVVSANAETQTKSFVDWAGGPRVTLAIVFTDVVGSTALGNKIGDERMNEVRNSHFTQGRKLLNRHHGREIKTIGDSLMVAFHSVDEALDFALAFRARPGHTLLECRAGIHVGAMQVEGNDVFGGTVNFTARVVAAIEASQIWLSDRAKEDVVALGAKRHRNLEWVRHNVKLKGFPGRFTLWSVTFAPK